MLLSDSYHHGDFSVSRQHNSNAEAPSAMLTHVDARTRCHRCVQVYDLRHKDAVGLALIRNGGLCTFCGTALPEAAAAAAAMSAAPATPSTSAQSAQTAGAAASGAAADDGSAAATADAERARQFAERLVEFDRTSAQRTEVIDDQGDYFEIESNQWLDAGEREALRARQAMQEALEEERRARVTVTVDLVGREERPGFHTRCVECLHACVPHSWIDVCRLVCAHVVGIPVAVAERTHFLFTNGVLSFERDLERGGGSLV